MAHFYLADDIGASDLAVGRLLVLAGQEARHAVTVSRVRSGERILVGDGRGTIASGTVTSAEPQRLELRVDAVEAHPEPTPRVVLVQALAKGDRDELAVQAATELGVDAVIPWQAQRSVSRWEGQKVTKGRDRWRAIVREAVKQSIRPRVPEVEALATTKDRVRMAATAACSCSTRRPSRGCRGSTWRRPTATRVPRPTSCSWSDPRAASPPRRSSRSGRRGRSRSRSARGSSARRPRGPPLSRSSTPRSGAGDVAGPA